MTYNVSSGTLNPTLSVDSMMCVCVTGGETIRDICRQSGAHVELNRDQSANSLERVFRISGLPEQMQQAMRLISEKAGIVSHTVNSASVF